MDELSRRRVLALAAPMGLGGLLAGCAAGGGAGSTPVTPADPLTAAALALLGTAHTCRVSPQLAQGPYWFDVDSIRSDLREDRPGVTLRLAIRVQQGCVPLPNTIVEIWQADARGIYSGFGARSAAPTAGAPPKGWPNGSGAEVPAGDPTADPMGYPGPTSSGSYTRGDAEATRSGDGTYLRGAQVADANGVVQFTTIYPGWYTGRTPHIHVKVHLNRRTLLATQLFFDDALTDQVYASEPYRAHTGSLPTGSTQPRSTQPRSTHTRSLPTPSTQPRSTRAERFEAARTPTGRDTRNATDALFTPTGLLTIRRHGDAYLAALNLGVDVRAPAGASGSVRRYP